MGKEGLKGFVSKVMSLLFNMLSRLVINFLPRSKRLLISWLQSPSTVILEPKKNKVCHCFHVSPYICREVMEPEFILNQPFNCLILLNETTPTDIELWAKYLAVLLMFLAINMFFHQKILETNS